MRGVRLLDRIDRSRKDSSGSAGAGDIPRSSSATEAIHRTGRYLASVCLVCSATGHFTRMTESSVLTAALTPSWATEMRRTFTLGGVEPAVGPVGALQRPVEEGFDPVVDLGAQPADLAPREACPAHRLDEVVRRWSLSSSSRSTHAARDGAACRVARDCRDPAGRRNPPRSLTQNMQRTIFARFSDSSITICKFSFQTLC